MREKRRRGEDGKGGGGGEARLWWWWGESARWIVAGGHGPKPCGHVSNVKHSPLIFRNSQPTMLRTDRLSGTPNVFQEKIDIQANKKKV